MVVMLYLHQVSHNLKKIGNRVGADVVFSAPLKLQGLCVKVNKTTRTRYDCNKKQCEKLGSCMDEAVYRIPLDSGREHIYGQMGRCLNDCLWEHSNNVNNLVKTGHLATHCFRCGCKPLFDKTQIVSRNPGQVTRKIIEAFEMIRSNNTVICPSVSLSKKEIVFLLQQQPVVDD